MRSFEFLTYVQFNIFDGTFLQNSFITNVYPLSKAPTPQNGQTHSNNSCAKQFIGCC